MSERHPNVKCMVTWCDYWIKTLEGEHSDKIGGCDTYDLLISTLSGDKYPTCAGYKIHSDPSKRGIHG